MTIYKIKRIYELPEKGDGYRVLIDRLWPRGVSKERAKLNEWAKEVAPSSELRKWFNHDSEKFAKFSKRYFVELKNNNLFYEKLIVWNKQRVVTLLYGARDSDQNEVVVLREFIKKTKK